MAFDSIIVLYKNVPLSPSQNKSFMFHTPEAFQKITQHDFFYNKFDKLSFFNLKWIKENEINLEVEIHELDGFNYMSYQNEQNERVFAFIIDKKYVSDRITKITIEIDYFQTYLFDFDFLPSYIEREHFDRWELNAGGNTISPLIHPTLENIDLGSNLELVDEIDVSFDRNNPFKSPVLLITTKPYNNNIPDDVANAHKFSFIDDLGRRYITPYYIYLSFKNDDLSESDKFRVLSATRENGSVSISTENVEIMSADLPINPDDSILAYIPVQSLPFNITRLSGTSGYHYNLNTLGDTIDFVAHQYDTTNLPDKYHLLIRQMTGSTKVAKQLSQFIDNLSLPKPTGTPFHNRIYESKLQNSEFKKIRFQSNYSSFKELKTEMMDLTKSQFNFDYKFNPSIDFREWIQFPDYLEPNSDLIVADERSLPINSSAYANFIRNTQAQKQAGMFVEATQTASSVITNLSSGNYSGALMGVQRFAGNRIMENAKITDLKNMPDSIRNSGGDVSFLIQRNEFKYKIQISKPKDFYLENVYNYLRLYGYKSGRIGIPNLKNRYFYNYVETRNANLKPKGKIDGFAIEKIKNIFDNGITILHLRGSSPTLNDNMLGQNYENFETSIVGTS